MRDFTHNAAGQNSPLEKAGNTNASFDLEEETKIRMIQRKSSIVIPQFVLDGDKHIHNLRILHQEVRNLKIPTLSPSLEEHAQKHGLSSLLIAKQALLSPVCIKRKKWTVVNCITQASFYKKKLPVMNFLLESQTCSTDTKPSRADSSKMPLKEILCIPVLKGKSSRAHFSRSISEENLPVCIQTKTHKKKKSMRKKLKKTQKEPKIKIENAMQLYGRPCQSSENLLNLRRTSRNCKLVPLSKGLRNSLT